MRTGIGLVVLALPLLAIFGVLVARDGWREALTVAGLTAAFLAGVMACVAMGLYLLAGGVGP